VPSWRERRQWRREFKDRGVDNVRLMVSHSNFGEEKLRYARKWLARQGRRVGAHPLVLVFMGITAAAAVATAVITVIAYLR
jgi:hypothetical protein